MASNSIARVGGSIGVDYVSCFAYTYRYDEGFPWRINRVTNSDVIESCNRYDISRKGLVDIYKGRSISFRYFQDLPHFVQCSFLANPMQLIPQGYRPAPQFSDKHPSCIWVTFSLCNKHLYIALTVAINHIQKDQFLAEEDIV